MSGTRSTIVFAGGGTGGHLMPSLAVAERLPEQADALGVDLPRVHFICSTKPLDAELLRSAGRTFTPLRVIGLGRNPLGWPRFAARQLHAIHVARCDLAMRDAGCVVAMGGYAASPVVVAAKRLNLPVILVNLDAVAGKANRRLAGRADGVYSVHGKAGLPGRVTPIGFPLRQSALARHDPAESRRRLGLDPDRPVLLVTGASQGAQTINEAMVALARGGFFEPFGARGWQVLHLAGAGNTEPVEQAYREQGVAAKVMAFCSGMGEAWGAADLAISRAGAGSAAEAQANAVPAIFLPYPFHRDQHQRHNVQAIVDKGAAVVLDDRRDAPANARALGPVLGDLMNDDERRRAMRARLRQAAAVDGARALAGAALRMLNPNSPPLLPDGRCE